MNGEYGTTIFCDDIRNEVDGKKTYVGVYGQDMVITGPFPALVPQFAFAVTLLEPIESAERQLNIKILMPGENGEEVALDVDLPEGRHGQIAAENLDSTAQYVGSMMTFKVSPLIIANEGSIRVRAYKDGREIRLGSIRVRLAKHETIE